MSILKQKILTEKNLYIGLFLISISMSFHICSKFNVPDSLFVATSFILSTSIVINAFLSKFVIPTILTIVLAVISNTIT